jgi:hypothetical protein
LCLQRALECGESLAERERFAQSEELVKNRFAGPEADARFAVVEQGAEGDDGFGGAVDELAERGADQLVARLGEPAGEDRVSKTAVRRAYGDAGRFGCLLDGIAGGQCAEEEFVASVAVALLHRNRLLRPAYRKGTGIAGDDRNGGCGLAELPLPFFGEQRARCSRSVDQKEAPVHHQAISDPSEVIALTPVQLFQGVKPLLRLGGLLSNNERLERIKPNIHSVCFELGEEWRKSPILDEREVPFSEYLAARLCTKLRALDRQQNPDLYDRHGKYRPDGHTLPLETEPDGGAESWIPLPTASVSYPSLTQTATWPQELLKAANQIAQPSLTALMELMTHIARGGKSSPYRTARGLGLTPAEAHSQPATAAHLQIIDFLAGYSATAGATGPR